MDNLKKSRIKFYGYGFAVGIFIVSFFIFISMGKDYSDNLFLLFLVAGVIFFSRMGIKSIDDYSANERLANPDVYVVINHTLYEQYENGTLKEYFYYRNDYIVILPSEYTDKKVYIKGLILHRLNLNTTDPYKDDYCKLLNPENYYYVVGEYTENEHGKIVSDKVSKTEEEVLKLLNNGADHE